MQYKPEYLQKYVDLAVHMGANIQPGQKLVVRASVECAYFVRMITEAAYRRGARDVIQYWTDEKCARLRYDLAPDEIFDEFPEWIAKLLNGSTAEGAALISVSAADPEAFKGVDSDRILRYSRAQDKALKDYRERVMSSRVQWCVISVPTEKWAQKVFPNESAEVAVQKLWEAIFAASRIDEGNPIDNWEAHVAAMRKHVKILNDYHFKALRFQNAAGTDLTVELPEKHIWGGGDEHATTGIRFLANIPTEEIFTAPKRDGVNGTVVTAKPTVYNGNIIERFQLTFKDGKVVGWHTEEGADLLEKLLISAENMDYLGEVALVPYHSPISRSNILFYNTLYDENASCHLALGRAYPHCIQGGADMTRDEQIQAGLNLSDDHHDFMIGTKDMKITGITSDGREIDVFINGNYAF